MIIYLILTISSRSYIIYFLLDLTFMRNAVKIHIRFLNAEIRDASVTNNYVTTHVTKIWYSLSTEEKMCQTI